LGVVLERGAWEEPRIFGEIRRLGAVSEHEMDRVFNRGVGMALVLDPSAVDEGLASLTTFGLGASVIGEVVRGEPGVRYR
jgi:phosphoribosylformylglycinamidine cyclo-ligase